MHAQQPGAMLLRCGDTFVLVGYLHSLRSLPFLTTYHLPLTRSETLSIAKSSVKSMAQLQSCSSTWTGNTACALLEIFVVCLTVVCLVIV
jgi:hypothetical protein